MSGIPLPEFITVYNFVYISDVITWFTLYSGSVSLNSSTSLSIYSPSSPVNGVQNSTASSRSEEHTSELQSRFDLVCRLLLEKKNNIIYTHLACKTIRTINI